MEVERRGRKYGDEGGMGVRGGRREKILVISMLGDFEWVEKQMASKLVAVYILPIPRFCVELRVKGHVYTHTYQHFTSSLSVPMTPELVWLTVLLEQSSQYPKNADSREVQFPSPSTRLKARVTSPERN